MSFLQDNRCLKSILSQTSRTSLKMSQYQESPPPYTPPGHPQTSPYSPFGQKSSEHQQASAPPPPGIHTSSTSGVGAPKPNQPPIIIYSNTTVTPVQYGPYPMRITCPNCNAQVMTETHSTPGLLTYILSGALCILAGYFLCCLVPCCVRECKDIEHRCPNCRQRLSLYKRI